MYRNKEYTDFSREFKRFSATPLGRQEPPTSASYRSDEVVRSRWSLPVAGFPTTPFLVPLELDCCNIQGPQRSWLVFGRGREWGVDGMVEEDHGSRGWARIERSIDGREIRVAAARSEGILGNALKLVLCQS